jgi:hypothetical protein
MESAYFLYKNYPYIVGLYGYYKVFHNGYENYKYGKWVYDTTKGVYHWIFSPSLEQDWIALGESLDQIEVIDYDNNNEPLVLIEKNINIKSIPNDDNLYYNWELIEKEKPDPVRDIHLLFIET